MRLQKFCNRFHFSRDEKRIHESHFLVYIYKVVIVIAESITSVFKTDALMSQNHDLFESLVVKKRIKVDREGTWCLQTTATPRCLHLQTVIQVMGFETDNKDATDTDWQSGTVGI
ncbi:hypothetical protein T265_00929 [Opisthorchis viverrini]|uniref:Uncharacterized protein n=1 Tax=Opisthorchis viverrini TaxID=6198 RepID=A0A075ABP3_OPIVI|nr:hypothetical protein T265_00929 [Opisthorchis viverrini]KER33245.1 hypothetical protein T265_00929 [Opisthorchis viverrini]